MENQQTNKQNTATLKLRFHVEPLVDGNIMLSVYDRETGDLLFSGGPMPTRHIMGDDAWQ